MFTLVRNLAKRLPVTEIAAPNSLVQRHLVAPLAARAGLSRFRDDLARATLDWARIEHELPAVVAALRNAGVRVAPIKGTAYAKQLYTVPAERPMADVDLLVPLHLTGRASDVLTKLDFAPGVSPALHHAQVWIRGDFVIDLHWNIIAPGRSQIDLAGIWSRTRPGWPVGAEQLDPVDALVFHLVNIARNRLRAPLIHVIDTSRLLAQLHGDAAPALARADQWGLHRAAALALRFARSVLDSTPRFPAGVLGPTATEAVALDEPGFVRKIIFDVATAGSPRQLAARVRGYAANLVDRSRR